MTLYLFGLFFDELKASLKLSLFFCVEIDLALSVRLIILDFSSFHLVFGLIILLLVLLSLCFIPSQCLSARLLSIRLNMFLAVILFLGVVFRFVWLTLVVNLALLVDLLFLLEVISLFGMHLVLLDLELVGLLNRHVIRMILRGLSLAQGRLLRFVSLLLFHAVEEVKLSVGFRLLGHPWSTW